MLIIFLFIECIRVARLSVTCMEQCHNNANFYELVCHALRSAIYQKVFAFSLMWFRSFNCLIDFFVVVIVVVCCHMKARPI